MSRTLRVGVLALQGGFAPHRDLLAGLGAEAVEVRDAGDLEGLDAAVIPGGESTVLARLAAERGLDRGLKGLAARGAPLLGTCAGAILLAEAVEGGASVSTLGLLPVTVRRNAYGRQRASFVTRPPEAARHRVFIRAPRFASLGEGVEVLDRLEADGEPVAVRAGAVLAATYHPELAADPWLHQLLLDQVGVGAAAS